MLLRKHFSEQDPSWKMIHCKDVKMTDWEIFRIEEMKLARQREAIMEQERLLAEQQVCVCMYLYMHLYVYLCVYLYVYLCAYLYLCLCVHIVFVLQSL